MSIRQRIVITGEPAQLIQALDEIVKQAEIANYVISHTPALVPTASPSIKVVDAQGRQLTIYESMRDGETQISILPQDRGTYAPAWLTPEDKEWNQATMVFFHDVVSPCCNSSKIKKRITNDWEWGTISNSPNRSFGKKLLDFFGEWFLSAFLLVAVLGIPAQVLLYTAPIIDKSGVLQVSIHHFFASLPGRLSLLVCWAACREFCLHTFWNHDKDASVGSAK
jgi:hypothetical protein